MAKKDDKLKISFIGGNADDVTGSATLLEWNDRHILIDCGLIQGGTTLQDYRANKKMLTQNKLKHVDTVIVGELHADHTCNIPYITKINKDCKVITAKNHKNIYRCMFEDSALISLRDCEMLSNQYEDKQFVPNYDLDDVEYCLSKIKELNVGERIQIDDDITVKFVYSGHIFACCQIELWINVNGKIKHLLFTEDLGNTLNAENRPFTQEFEKVESATLVIGESTYGARDKKSCTNKIIKKDVEKINTVIDQYAIDLKSRVLIPTFSLDKTPAMLYMIWKQFKDNPNFTAKVVIDSPLANKLLDVYLEELNGDKKELLNTILSWENIVRVISPEDSKYVMDNYKNAVIISSSGMLSIGRSKLWLKQVTKDPTCCILMTGYCSPNTLGYKIRNCSDKKTITIDNKQYPNRANIVNIVGQSSHMQRNELIEYYSSINAEKICLVHGNMNGRIELAEDLKKELSNKSKTTKVCVVNKGTTLTM